MTPVYSLPLPLHTKLVTASALTVCVWHRTRLPVVSGRIPLFVLLAEQCLYFSKGYCFFSQKHTNSEHRARQSLFVVSVHLGIGLIDSLLTNLAISLNVQDTFFVVEAREYTSAGYVCDLGELGLRRLFLESCARLIPTLSSGRAFMFRHNLDISLAMCACAHRSPGGM